MKCRSRSPLSFPSTRRQESWRNREKASSQKVNKGEERECQEFGKRLGFIWGRIPLNRGLQNGAVGAAGCPAWWPAKAGRGAGQGLSRRENRAAQPGSRPRPTWGPATHQSRPAWSPAWAGHPPEPPGLQPGLGRLGGRPARCGAF